MDDKVIIQLLYRTFELLHQTFVNPRVYFLSFKSLYTLIQICLRILGIQFYGLIVNFKSFLMIA